MKYNGLKNPSIWVQLLLVGLLAIICSFTIMVMWGWFIVPLACQQSTLSRRAELICWSRSLLPQNRLKSFRSGSAGHTLQYTQL